MRPDGRADRKKLIVSQEKSLVKKDESYVEKCNKIHSHLAFAVEDKEIE